LHVNGGGELGLVTAELLQLDYFTSFGALRAGRSFSH